MLWGVDACVGEKGGWFRVEFIFGGGDGEVGNP